MIKLIIFLVGLVSFNSYSQSYAPAANQIGTTAISKDSNIFVSWATGIELKRGFLNISDTNFQLNGTNKVTHGLPEAALFQAEGTSADIVSLGDGGIATLTFEAPIKNDIGPDFAVFENSFLSNYLELAFVEVSSDGIHFVRFPAHTEVSFVTQIGGFEFIDCRYLNNFAGKFEQGYGTPFDLSDLPQDSFLNLDYITHVRIIDVVGSIDSQFATFDSFGNVVNDPFPTPFESGGFDLDGVGVIHQGLLGIKENFQNFSFYPNPAKSEISIATSEYSDIQLIDLSGKIIDSFSVQGFKKVDLQHLERGVYLLNFSSKSGRSSKKLILE
jgi:hypothetical protein